MNAEPQVFDRLTRALAAEAVPSSDYDLAPEVLALLPSDRRLRPAAVLVPLVARAGGGLSVILTRRSTRLRHHPGQIAFPGGKLERGEDFWTAALREAHEEIGLTPDLVARSLGTLPRHETVTSFTVEPHVALIEQSFAPLPCEDEVAEVFEVPLGFLMEPAHYQTHARVWRGIERQYYAVPYGPYYIWGATARILKGLADRMGPA